MWFTDGLVSLLEQGAQQHGTSITGLDYNLVFEVLSLITILVLAIIVRGRVSASTNRNDLPSVQLVKNLSDLFTEYLHQSEHGSRGLRSPGETPGRIAGIRDASGTSEIEDERKG